MYYYYHRDFKLTKHLNTIKFDCDCVQVVINDSDFTTQSTKVAALAHPTQLTPSEEFKGLYQKKKKSLQLCLLLNYIYIFPEDAKLEDD